MSRNYRTIGTAFDQILMIVTYTWVILTFLLILGWMRAPIGEDDSRFNCYAHGNRICAEPSAESTAWQAWDSKGGYSLAAHILNNYASSRVEYVGVAVFQPQLSNNQVAVHWEDGRWYVFRAVND